MQRRTGGVVVWLVFGALFLLHHDFWNWDNRGLLLGWMPVGMAWHVGFSLIAALFWAVVCRRAWPVSLEAWASSGPADPDPLP